MYRKRYYGNSLVSRAKRQYKAADQQRDSTTIVVNHNIEFQCGETMICPDGADAVRNNFIDSGTAAISVYDILRQNDYFENYRQMYDQVCINNVRVKIIGVNWTNSSRDGIDNGEIEEWKSPKSYIVVTAWDRTGLSRDQYKIQSNVVQAAGQVVNCRDLYTTIGRSITTYSSAITKHLGPGSAYEIVRQLYPQALTEKEQYVSCSLLKEQQIASNESKFKYRMYEEGVVITDPDNPEVEAVFPPVAIEQDESLPTNLIESPSLAFKPVLLVNVIAGEAPEVVGVNRRNRLAEGGDIRRYIGVNKVRPVTFSAEFHITVTFRGLRCSKIV